MGGSTFAIGLVPGYQSIGILAPILVLILRLLQGLALGGEYGGAATYVAEHAPAAKRGYYTSFIQTTATLGLFVSIGVILAVRQWVGVEAFNEWGWRVPFILSSLLVGVSIYIRLKMNESPLFAKLKAEGKISKNPIKESFGKKENLTLVLIALFGATAGQGVVWYTGQFYAMTFIEKTGMVDFVQTRDIIAIALLIGTPFFVVFGGWSDRVGRKYIMLAGMLLAVFLYRPIYGKMLSLTKVSEKIEIESNRITERVTSISAANENVVTVKHKRFYTDETISTHTEKFINGSDTPSESKTEIVLGNTNYWLMIALVVVQVIFVTMVYGPIAAFLVELFPTKIRYTSMSLPYHIGNGVFGGFVPLTATYLASKYSDPLAGLWYPIGVAAITFVIGLIFLSNHKRAEVME
jgi:MHS family proline/betaine transporter-like MFS transporter